MSEPLSRRVPTRFLLLWGKKKRTLDVHPRCVDNVLSCSGGSPETDVSPGQHSDEDGALSTDSTCDLIGSSSAINPSPDSDANVDGSDGVDHIHEGTGSAGLDQKLNYV